MAKKKLVILESPGKAPNVGRYLGSKYEVVSSMGHLRDLPKSTLGVDIENNFEPKYIPIRGREKTIKEIKTKAAAAEMVYLAADPDREGEAISWHIAALLGLPPEKCRRVTFNEITKKAVLAGMENPRDIDTDLVDAYQARRVLDRVVGYKISPLLWKKVRPGLSAGRVQSVVTRMVVDRENEIRSFVPEEYWNVFLKLSPNGKSEKTFNAKFWGKDGRREELHSEAEAKTVTDAVTGATAVCDQVKKERKPRQPAPPFITSSLLQEASRRLAYTSRRTMKLAQDLYEGFDIPGHGSVGLITYMRTDSLRLSDDSVEAARSYIAGRFGESMLPEKPRVFRTDKNAQDAHEAIRPTYPDITPDDVKGVISGEHYRLYKLIWERFIACQMQCAWYDTVSLTVACGGYTFRANGRTLVSPGFTALYEEATDDTPEEDTALPEIEKNEALLNHGVTSEQKFTQPPARYTEASLINAMKENNIGRPSTYAPTIGTITEREYVEKEGKSLKPTALGEVVTGLMLKEFTDIMDIEFTAGMEENLDRISEGKLGWREVMTEFYGGFEKELKKAEEDISERVKVPDVVSDVKCDKCGANMVVKSSRFGKFLACPNYPECKNTKPMASETPGICPKCGGKVLERISKNKNKFYACEKGLACGFITWDKPLAEVCPNCGGSLFRKYTHTEKKIYCAAEGCGYEREYRPRGRAKQTADGIPDENE